MALRRSISNSSVNKPVVKDSKLHKRDVGMKGVSNSGSSKVSRLHLAATPPQSRPYRCSSCPATFGDSNDLKSHQQLHTGGFAYTCSVCHANFTYHVDFGKHKRVHLPNYEQYWYDRNKTVKEALKCEECGDLFDSKISLGKHKIVHRPERPHVCGTCGSSFRYVSQLESHVRIDHRSMKPFSCPHCNSKFATEKEHVSHKILHSTK